MAPIPIALSLLQKPRQLQMDYPHHRRAQLPFDALRAHSPEPIHINAMRRLPNGLSLEFNDGDVQHYSWQRLWDLTLQGTDNAS